MVEYTRQMLRRCPGSFARPAEQRCANRGSESCVRNFTTVKCFAAQRIPLKAAQFS